MSQQTKESADLTILPSTILRGADPPEPMPKSLLYFRRREKCTRAHPSILGPRTGPQPPECVNEWMN